MYEPQRHGDTELVQINKITERTIGCAIEVHRCLGPGLLESMYQRALCIELDDAQLPYVDQLAIPAFYKGRLLGDYRVDLIVEDQVVVEVKCVEKLLPVHTAQAFAYLKLTGLKLALVINFNVPHLRHGIKRVINGPESEL